jgi:transcriptional regulator with XRE-family HTH domain
MLGGDLRNKRVQLGLSGDALCKRAGLSRSRLSYIERGYVIPNNEEAARINRALADLRDAKRNIRKVARQVAWPEEI